MQYNTIQRHTNLILMCWGRVGNYLKSCFLEFYHYVSLSRKFCTYSKNASIYNISIFYSEPRCLRPHLLVLHRVIAQSVSTTYACCVLRTKAEVKLYDVTQVNSTRNTLNSSHTEPELSFHHFMFTNFNVFNFFTTLPLSDQPCVVTT